MTKNRITILVVINTLSVACAWKNLHDEFAWDTFADYGIYYCLCLGFWIFFPVMAIVLGRALRSHFISRTMFGLSLFYFVPYAFYALNGPSDPDTAGHMHILIVPVLLLIVTVFVVLLDAVRHIFRREAKTS